MTAIELTSLLRPMTSAEDETSRRKASSEDPERFHGDVAAGELHWFDSASGDWLSVDGESQTWKGRQLACAPAAASPVSAFQPFHV
ncbi:MAG: hypothetical protein AAFU79_23820 [Myxococcota bacterium]